MEFVSSTPGVNIHRATPNSIDELPRDKITLRPPSRVIVIATGITVITASCGRNSSSQLAAYSQLTSVRAPLYFSLSTNSAVFGSHVFHCTESCYRFLGRCAHFPLFIVSYDKWVSVTTSDDRTKGTVISVVGGSAVIFRSSLAR